MTGLKWLEIEAFRGFAAKRRIDLDADFVLLTGGNGVGKSSVVDAITWLLTGNIEHVGQRKQKRTEEYVLNAYRAGESARVSAGMLIGEQDAMATRVGNSNGSSLRLEVAGRRLSGDAAEIELARLFGAGSPADFTESMNRWGVLRQDEVRAVLDANPDEIHGRLRDLLGLSVLDQFETFADEQHRERSKMLAELRKRLESEQAELDALESRISSLDERIASTAEDAEATHRLRQVSEELRAVVALDVSTAASLTSQRDAAAQLRTIYATLQQLRRELLRIDEDIAAAPVPPITEHELRERREARQATQARLAEQHSSAVAALRAAERTADQLSALAAAAIPLLDNNCPVCDQPIDAAAVEQRLHDLASASAAGTISAARAAVDQVVLLQQEFDARSRGEVLEEDESQAHARRGAELRAMREEIVSQLRDLTAPGIDLPRLHREPTVAALETTIEAVTAVGRAVRAVVASAEVGELATQRAELTGSYSAALSRRASTRQELDRTGALVKESDAVRKAAKSAGVEVTQTALTALNPHFGEVYRRLAPHPTFTDLGLRHDVYYNKGRTLPVLSDPVAQVTANPGVICSIGQLNVVALSYFLALALLGDEPPLPFIILDDPMQSLDDLNVLGFADLCRYLRQRRQVIVTTHDRRYAELLERKLAPRDDQHASITVEFEAWDRSGPKLAQNSVPRVAVPQLLAVTPAA